MQKLDFTLSHLMNQLFLLYCLLRVSWIGCNETAFMILFLQDQLRWNLLFSMASHNLLSTLELCMNGHLELSHRPAMTGAMFAYVLPMFFKIIPYQSGSQTIVVQWCSLAGMQVHNMPEYGD